MPEWPGGGKPADTVLDKLSALIATMNEKYGADLGEADKDWVDQQWVGVKDDDDMRSVALNNDRGQYELVLAERIKDSLLGYLSGTYDEFHAEMGSA